MKSKKLFAGVWIGATALAALGAVAVASRGRGTVYARSALRDPVARDVVNLVDGVVQDRFRRPLDRTFGISRIALPKDARMIHSRSTVPADKPVLASSARRARQTLGSIFLDGATAALKEHEPLLNAGRSLEASADGWRLYARPVLADKSCIDCHTAAKTGEALGVVAYAVEGPATEGN